MREKMFLNMPFNQENLQELMDRMPLAIFSVKSDDAVSPIYISPNIQRITGYPSEKFQNDSSLFFHIVHPDDQDYLLREIAKQRSRNAQIEIEYRIITADGSEKWIRNFSRPVLLDNGSVERIDGFIEDITRQKKIETELNKSRKKYYTLFENAGDAIYIFSSTDFKIIDANRQAADMIGYTGEELYRMSVYDISASAKDKIAEIVSAFSRKAVYRFEDTFIHKDGSRIPVELTSITIDYEDRDSYQTIVRDISERKRNETNLKLARSSAENANRAKSEFLSNMSHELRTPLNAILGFCQILQLNRSGNLTEKQFEHLGYISESGTHLLEMIDDILDISKSQIGDIDIEKKPFDMVLLLNRSQTTVLPLARAKQITLNIEIDEYAGWLNGDEARIKQVIYNLLSNAIKYTDPGKNVGLKAKGDRGFIHITIWDEGSGISENFIPRLFNPFEKGDNIDTAKNYGAGTGLTISKKIIELHGGSISVKSSVGIGTEFSIIIPERMKRPV